MAAFINIDIRGEREIDRLFAKAPEAFTASVIMPALEGGARIVKVDAKARVRKVSHRLERSIRTESMPQILAVKIYTDEPYAKRIERGFVGKDSLGRRYNQPAQPYLVPALNMNREPIVREVRNAIVRRLKRAVR